jgi:hypothetical protein
MTLFGVYKKTSPMGYVRFCREMEKRNTQGQAPDLFSAGPQKQQDNLL